MDTDRRKLRSGAQTPTGETLQPIGSHDVALARPLQIEKRSQELVESNISAYHLTARLTHNTLTPREVSLILSVLEYQIVWFGCNFPMYLALTELSLRLSGGKDSTLINDPNIRLSVSLSEILIKDLGRHEFSLDSRQFALVSAELGKILKPYLMDKRTYGSRFSTWRPEKYVVVRAVPVERIFERDSKTSSERYSSYCKGYGESHGNAHRQATKPSTELDGDPKAPDSSERNLIQRVSNPDHQRANSLWIKIWNWLSGK